MLSTSGDVFFPSSVIVATLHGSWVRKAMAFMDEQGMGPCGHMAKRKGILVKVYASCQAIDLEIPFPLAFSTNCAKN